VGGVASEQLGDSGAQHLAERLDLIFAVGSLDARFGKRIAESSACNIVARG
jgi:hypothetical protein